MIGAHAAVQLGERAWAVAVCGGALAWRPQAAPVFEQRVELARAGRMDEIAAGVAGTGLSERCRAEDPRLLGLMRELIASNDPDAYADWSAATAPAAMPDLARLRCPLLACCGSEDPVAPPATAEAVAAAAADGRTAVIDGTAHWCGIEDPAATTDVLFDFLDAVVP
jgi:pimeloyl-ACP methyl ester carboxylesterase